MRQSTLAFFMVFFGLVCASTAGAETLEAGKVYKGKTTLDVVELQVGFTLPKGWTGTVPAGTELFVMQQGNGDEGNIFVASNRMSTAEVRAAMKSGFPLDPQVVLQPKSPLKESKGLLEGEFTVANVDQLSAYVVSKPLKNGVTVVVVALSTHEARTKYQGVARTVASSSTTKKVAKPKAAAAPKGAWARELANKKLYNFYHGSGYSEKEVYTFCGNGVFFRNFDASSVSQLGTGAAVARGDGRWSVNGSTLILKFNNGNTTQSPLEKREGSLYVDGSKWLREDFSCN